MTIRSARRILKRALAKTVKWGKLRENPAADVETPKGTRSNHRAMAEDEAVAFLVAAKENPDDLILIFVPCTGLRQVEFIAVQRPELELDREFEARRGQAERLMWTATV